VESEQCIGIVRGDQAGRISTNQRPSVQSKFVLAKGVQTDQLHLGMIEDCWQCSPPDVSTSPLHDAVAGMGLLYGFHHWFTLVTIR